MSFYKDLASSHAAVDYVAANVIDILELEDASVSHVEPDRDIQRISGDLLLTYRERDYFYEVKHDFAAAKYGNLFLETLSDTGERTGRETVGWFRNPESKIHYYVFVVGNYEQIIHINANLLKLYVSKQNFQERTISNPTLVKQYNRSRGILCPIQKLCIDLPYRQSGIWKVFSTA